jgi:hypothetical protein
MTSLARAFVGLGFFQGIPHSANMHALPLTSVPRAVRLLAANLAVARALFRFSTLLFWSSRMNFVAQNLLPCHLISLT